MSGSCYLGMWITEGGKLHIDIQDSQNQFRHNTHRIGRFAKFVHKPLVPGVYAALEYGFQGAQEAFFPCPPFGSWKSRN